MPASPPPTTTIRFTSSPRQAARREPRLLPGRQRDPPLQDLVWLVRYPVEDAAVDPSHRQHARGAARVEHVDQAQPAVEPLARAQGLKADQLGSEFGGAEQPNERRSSAGRYTRPCS